MPTKSPYLLKAADIAADEGEFSHPWNDNSLIHGSSLSRKIGMSRAMVSIATLPSGKGSYIYHSHHYEEEWIYILSGSGTAEIDDAEYEVGPGDFMGFPTPSVAHHLRNTGSEDLTYLQGGESLDEEIADFPRLGKRKVFKDGKLEVIDLPED